MLDINFVQIYKYPSVSVEEAQKQFQKPYSKSHTHPNDSYAHCNVKQTCPVELFSSID